MDGGIATVPIETGAEVIVKAVVQRSYGSPDVLRVEEVPAPACAKGQVRVEVRASAVSYGDVRLRSADFPAFSALIGRLVLGVTGPRRPVPGTVFAGRVVEVGEGAEGFAVGDDVFGLAANGAYAEELTIDARGPIAPLPAGIGYAEAAAVPYAGITSLVFLRDVLKVQPGQRVAIVGAGGGVGHVAVQVAAHLGAEVVAVCRPEQAAWVTSLGARSVVPSLAEVAAVDAIFDTVTPDFGACVPHLGSRGRAAFLVATTGLLFRALWTAVVGGPRALVTVAVPSRAVLDVLAQWMAEGALKPQIDAAFPLDAIAAAHARGEARGRKGAVIVEIGDAPRRADRRTA